MTASTKRLRVLSLSLTLVLVALALAGIQAVLATAPANDSIVPYRLQPATPTAPGARLHIAHLAPFAADPTPGTGVTITLDGTDLFTDVVYGVSTGYLNVTSGTHQVQIFAGSVSTPAISATVFLTDGMDFTAIATGGASGWDLGLELLEDDNTAPTSGYAKVRIGHLAPFAATITDTLADVRLQNGTILTGFNDVPFSTIADYIELAAGEYDLKITNADGTATLIDPMPVDLTDGQILSVLAAGDTQNQPVGVYALPSVTAGAFLTRATNVQLAHLAPFAMDPGTAVTVTINSQDVLTNVEFADSTGYLPIPEGDTQVQIKAGSSSTPAISVTVPLSHAMNYTAIAVGDVTNQPLTLTLLMDDLSAPTTGSAKVRIGHLAPFTDTLSATSAEVRQQSGPLVLPTAVTYGAISPYVELQAMAYDLKVTAPGGYPTLIDPMPVEPMDGDILSVFAVGNGPGKQPLGIFVLPAGAPGTLVDLAANVQIAHLAPFAMDPGTAVDIKVNGTQVLTDVAFADSTGYLPVKAGTTLVEVLPTGTSTVAISTTGYLTHAVDFTVLAIGNITNQPLDLMVLVDDNSPPTTGSAKVRIGHLAPFATVITDTWADIRLETGTLLPGYGNVPYGLVAPYTELVSGTYDLKVTAPGGTPTLINPSPFALMDEDILSVFAVGDGSKQPLGIFALPSGSPGSLLPVFRPRLYMPILAKMGP